ncbi:MAG TPA: glycerophosphodiester phosphodiesterase family protein [Dermatophilaceae bacterium]|nr:glycerophosphodiester phosphodiesterase family protein [Dermatophilaceae bacterium]
MPRAVPLVIAHRGSSALEPEHTLEAYLRAIHEGADALECDVRLTADRHLVCVHDRRVSRTSNGVGRVSTLELATLEGLDWGSWRSSHGFEPELPDRDRGRLLTLRRLLTSVLAADRQVGVAIETKHPTRYAGQVERELARTLAELGLDRRSGGPQVHLMSFSQLALSRMRQLCPALPLVYLMQASVPMRFRGGALPRGAGVAGLDKQIVRRWPATVRRQHRHGHQVFVWTVDDAEDVDLCLELGVEAIITNRPGFVRDRVDGSG